MTYTLPQAPKRPVVLLTGFDAFGGSPVNPSWLAVQALSGRQIAGHRLLAKQLPTEFGQSLHQLQRCLQQYRPALVICVGQASGRRALSLERVAINLNDAHMADNAGKQPIDCPVLEDGPPAYFSTLPLKAMLTQMKNEGLAAELSLSAGSYVCNQVFYGLMHVLATQKIFKCSHGGFIHVPYLPEQGEPNMPLKDMVRGLQIAIRCALSEQSK